MGIGRPDWIVRMVFSCQPAPSRFGTCGRVGTRYVMAEVHRWRVSKVDGPFSARRLSEFCGKAALAKLKSIQSEAPSIDFPHAYVENPENPWKWDRHRMV